MFIVGCSVGYLRKHASNCLNGGDFNKARGQEEGLACPEETRSTTGSVSGVLKEALNQEGCIGRLNVKVKTIIYVLINAEELLGKYL